MGRSGADQWERCPRCGEWFWAPLGYDPLKRHLDVCETRPADMDDRGDDVNADG